jgi:hypothetical protein
MNSILTYCRCSSCPGGRWQCESVNLLGRYANWSKSKMSDIMELMCAITSLSKHFMIIDVSATGQ